MIDDFTLRKNLFEISCIPQNKNEIAFQSIYPEDHQRSPGDLLEICSTSPQNLLKISSKSPQHLLKNLNIKISAIEY
jgi:hypothetical protein